ncbi:MAG: protoporphyrinogen oxidase [Elusimicrobiota bacterium]
MKPKAVVIGAGISGLSAAYELACGGRFAVTVLESSSRLGGKILSHQADDMVIEGGPDSFITAKPWALELVRELGLEADLIPTNSESKEVYVYTRKRLRRLPEGLMLMAPTKVLPFLASDLVGWGAKLRMGWEYFVPARTENDDESMGGFARRRFGGEALEVIVGPILAGIFAGDPDRLSMASTFPQFVDLERRHGSIIRGMRAAAARPAPKKDGKAWTMFVALRGGLSRLAEELAARLPEGAIKLDSAAEKIERAADGNYRITTAGGQVYAAERVIAAAPANHIAAALRPLDAELGGEVGGIPYSTTATVSLSYRAKDLPGPLAGFGFVVDRREPTRVMAATYSSTKFPGRVPPDKALIRCFLGGAGRESAADGSDAALVRAVREDLRSMLGLDVEPLATWTSRWRDANPQYNVGHAARIRRLEARVDGLPGFALAGAAYRGVGIPDCVRSGRCAARWLNENEGVPPGAVF